MILKKSADDKSMKKYPACRVNLLCMHPLAIRAGPRSAVGNVSGYRCVSDCRSRGGEFNPGPVPYFRGD